MPSKDFAHTGGWQRWNVPAKVEWVEVVVNGAGSGKTPGGRVTGRISVKGQRSLHILVGQQGQGPKGTQGGVATLGGGGKGGDGTTTGGWSGGGASVIRLNSKTGALRAAAAGAGGASGDDGEGGDGGADVGEAGHRGISGTGPTGNATGGTQIQGGFGGTSTLGGPWSGADAPATALAGGGAGGSSREPGTFGGGGGGGGYRAGGGGQAGLVDVAPGGGGGGGSNNRVALTGWSSSQGAGGTGHGSVTLTWVTPRPADQPPNAPADVRFGSKPAADEFTTHSSGRVRISARLNNPEPKQDVRLIAVYSANRSFSSARRVKSGWVERGKRADIVLSGLAQNTLWFVRLYAEDRRGLRSINYTSVNFWTNRSPNAPELKTPSENATLSELDPVLFEWSHTDPDDPQNPQQRAFELTLRRSRTPTAPAGDWKVRSGQTYDETWVEDAGTFAANNVHEWRVRTQDQQGAWGSWSETRSFFITGDTAPPSLVYPVNDEAVDVSAPVDLTWVFRDPHPGHSQASADLRYRAVGGEQWITLLGSTVYPGTTPAWTLTVGTLMSGVRYEWQVRTTDRVTNAVSQWSESSTFWTVRTPGILGVEPLFTEASTIEGELGCGHNQVLVYHRGGQRPVGTVKPLETLRYGRRRDDISSCVLVTNGFDEDCGRLLESVHTWMYELVVFRDGKRVWEGPITRIEDRPTGFEIEAKDVSAYLYRRIVRQGYNDTFRVINNTQMGQKTVVERAVMLTVNALAPDDPNLLPYLTSLNYPDDALQSRVLPDFSKTAWEEIDDMAANAGLDYTAVGRRLLYWDTHRPVGRLPEMRTEHFGSAPVISEYGMLLATTFGVTNNNGVYGVADRDTRPYPENPYGLIEQLASAYGETEAGALGESLTSEARENLERVLAEQAQRNIANRFPAPVVVRVPDGSTLSPTAPVVFEHLVPGTWIPLRASGTVRKLSQWQKLDAVEVTQDKDGEKVTVTMSPAPNAGADPDAEASDV